MATKKKILIIEDEPDVARGVQFLLDDAGYEATVALGGEEGLAKMKGFDLILLDLMMPKMSGRQVLKEMSKRSLKIPVIVVSAVGLPDTVKTELESYYPGTGFVSKAHVRELLLEEIAKVFAKK